MAGLSAWLLIFVGCFNVIHSRVLFPNVPESISRDSLIPDEFQLEELNLLDEQDPEITPGLFEGDQAIDNELFSYFRVGLRWDVFPEKLWPNRTIPYAISPLYEPSDMITILSAIRTLNAMTCVKFVKWKGKQDDFLLIWPIKYPKGCWSFVGKTGGPQILSLQPPDHTGPNCLGGPGRALHEIMHAMGIFHEQSRADRDRFVKVHWENIITGYKGNFEKQSLVNTTYSFEYDFDSIMHYGAKYFSKTKGKPTLTPRQPNVRIGQRKALTVTDCLKINDLYGCLDEPKLMKKYYNLCRVLGV